MTTYYVDPRNGSDVAAGTAVGTAWKTVDKAADTAVAGDTVYFAPGIYVFEPTIAFDADGTLGNEIKFIGDIKGEYFSDKGIALWTNAKSPIYGSSGHTSPGSFCDVTGDYLWFENITFRGDSQGGNGFLLTIDDSIGLIFYRCLFQQGEDSSIIEVIQTAASHDPANRSVIDSCTMYGSCFYFTAEPTNAVAQVDIGWTMQNCMCFAVDVASAYAAPIFVDYADSSDYGPGGIIIKHCTLIGDTQLLGNNDVVRPDYMLHYLVNSVVHGGTLTAGFAAEDQITDGTFLANSREHSLGLFVLNERHTDNAWIGGMTDLEYVRQFKATPYLPWEPYNPNSVSRNLIVCGADDTYDLSEDFYENLRGNAAGYTAGMFDGNVGWSDPDTAWSSEANLMDLEDLWATSIGTSTVGSNSSRYLLVQGVAGIGDVGIPIAVSCYFGGEPSNTLVRSIGYEISTASGAELLASGTWTMQASAGDDQRSAAITLTAPAAGWSWATIRALELKIWTSATSTTGPYVANCILDVQVKNGTSSGAVQNYQRPTPDATKQVDSKDSLKWVGAGMYQTLLPIPTAASHTVTVKTQTNSAYAGSEPLIRIKGMVGQATQEQAVTSVVDTWVETEVTITPTEAGWCMVQVYSRDSSGVGGCWLGSITVSED